MMTINMLITTNHHDLHSYADSFFRCFINLPFAGCLAHPHLSTFSIPDPPSILVKHHFLCYIESIIFYLRRWTY